MISWLDAVQLYTGSGSPEKEKIINNASKQKKIPVNLSFTHSLRDVEN